jgi:type II secretory pathway pseudopilin PulG
MKIARRKKREQARGFTLVEAVMSTLVVSLVLVAAMRVAGMSAVMQYKAAERVAGRYLADGLLNDIRQLAYQDPGSTVNFGIETGESANSKANYDDVDDFNGWTESPPQERTGTNISSFGNTWRRSVVVAWVNPSNLSQTSSTETGVKQITVNVYHNGLLIATRTALRSIAP